MKFQISKNKILNAVNLVKQGIANRTTNPILKTILIKADEDGWLTLQATNTQIFITASVKADKVDEAGACCVDSLVTSLLPSFEDGRYEDNKLTNPVKFALGESKLVISQGRRKHQPAYVPFDDFPKKPEIEDYVPVSSEDKLILVEALQRLQISIGVTEDRRILQGFSLNPHSKYIISGDGTRSSLRENINLPGNIAVLPARLLIPILPNLNTLNDKSQLEIRLGNPVSGFRVEEYMEENLISKWEIVVNCLDGEFPEKPLTLIKDSLNSEPKLKVITQKEKLSKILELCKIYSDRGYSEGKTAYYVTLDKNSHDLILTMNIPDLVKMEEPLECLAEGEEFSILFHPGMVLEALNVIKSENIELRFFGDKLPFLIIDPERPEFVYLQAPMAEKKVNTE